MHTIRVESIFMVVDGLWRKRRVCLQMQEAANRLLRVRMRTSRTAGWRGTGLATDASGKHAITRHCRHTTGLEP
jgi:hypothetical protein